MFKTSYSRVGTFTQCPHKFKLNYVDGLEVPFNCDAANPLVIGTMLHECIEVGIDEAIANYKAAYPVMTDLMVNELMKIRVLGSRARELAWGMLDDDADPVFETKVEDDSGFVGFIDMLIPRGKGLWTMLDFKYSNNVDRYLESGQLSVYKYFYEKTHPGEIIQDMAFLIVPKTMIRQKKTEDLYQFRERLAATLEDMWPTLYRVQYDPEKVADFAVGTCTMANATEFPKHESRLCDWCDYKDFCLGGNDMLILPKNERRPEAVITDPDMWIYADSYVGKSTFVDHFDDVLFINTDGNVSNITSPYIPIADELVHEGRMTKKILAWSKFREVIDELEKHENTFKVIALDLVEDLYEHCRFYVFDQLGIKHESDSGYGKGWDMVRTEFLSQMKRLKSLGYRIIYISKELVTEITYASGARVSTFKPNINDKAANVLAGTVTMTLRAYMDERGHFLQLRKNENVFGGGRIDFKRDRCDLTVDAFNAALLEAQGTKAEAEVEVEKPKARKKAEPKPKPEVEAETEVAEEPDAAEEKPKRRARKAKPITEEEPPFDTEEAAEPEAVEEKPKRRTRKRRVVEE